MLQIKRMPVGQIGTNCYLLEDTDAKLCAVIDLSLIHISEPTRPY